MITPKFKKENNAFNMIPERTNECVLQAINYKDYHKRNKFDVSKS